MMGIRTEMYLFCDECSSERQAIYFLPNQKAIKKEAKHFGFLVTGKNMFCSFDCKEAFNQRNTTKQTTPDK